MKLSENFTLQEYLVSQTALEHKISEQFAPPEKVITNIKILNGYVQQARTLMNRPFKITSGYRCKALNTRVGGVSNSEHLTGQGVDIAFNSVADAVKMAEIFIDLGIKRVGLGWNFLHIGISPTHPQKVVFMYGSRTPSELAKHQSRLQKRMK